MKRFASSIALLMLIQLISTQAAVPQTETVTEKASISTCDMFTESADDANSRNLSFGSKFFSSNNTYTDCKKKIYATKVWLVESLEFTSTNIDDEFRPGFKLAVCLNTIWPDAFDEGWKTRMSVYTYNNNLLWSMEIDSIEDCHGG